MINVPNFILFSVILWLLNKELIYGGMFKALIKKQKSMAVTSYC